MFSVFGCDFSGAKDASNKICVCEAYWDGKTLHLLRLVELEERLDLVHMIANHPGFWGIDMPFSIPETFVSAFGGWRAMLQSAFKVDRRRFKQQFPVRHSRASDVMIFRETDRAVDGKSPISSTPLDMLGMLYGSFKVLDALISLESVKVFPFMDGPDMKQANLFEVYPRTISNHLQLIGTESVSEIVEKFTNVFEQPLSIKLAERMEESIQSEHIRDSLYACLIMVYTALQCGLAESWANKPLCLSEQEWLMRYTEGAIIRLPFHP
jgi:hypothetical protein